MATFVASKGQRMLLPDAAAVDDLGQACSGGQARHFPSGLGPVVLGLTPDYRPRRAVQPPRDDE